MFVDVSMLNDMVTVSKATGETDRYDKAVMTEPVLLKFVRFDKSNGVSGTGNGKEKQNTSVLYVYPRYTINAPNFDNSWLDGIISYYGDNYIIKKIDTYSEAFSSKIFSYEIEVI